MEDYAIVAPRISGAYETDKTTNVEQVLIMLADLDQDRKMVL